jgi:hypothetical protein
MRIGRAGCEEELDVDFEDDEVWDFARNQGVGDIASFEFDAADPSPKGIEEAMGAFARDPLKRVFDVVLEEGGAVIFDADVEPLLIDG